MADTVTCTGCGGVVPMTALAAAVACPYCRRQIHLSPEDLSELAKYRAHVAGQLARAQEQRVYAEGWNRWYGSSDAKKKNHPLMPLFIWLGMVIPLALVGIGIQALGLEGSAIAKLMPAAMMGMCFLLIGGYMFWYYSGRRGSTRTTLLRAADVHCPSCGAPHQLLPGEVLQRCRFCSAPLMPNASVMDHGRAEVDRALLHAELERGRAERRGMTILSSTSAANAVPYIVLGSFLPMTGIGAIAVTFSFLTGQERDATWQGVLAIWVLAFTNVGLLALVYVYRRHRRENLAAVSAALISRFGGAVLADQWAMNGWMDRHWAGLVPIQQMFRGPYFHATALGIDGYPVLLVMNPVGADEKYYRGFVSVRIGAWLPDPERLAAHPTIAAARGSLRALGASLDVSRAGLTGLLLAKSARRIAKSENARALGDAMALLASTARQLDAKPVDIP